MRDVDLAASPTVQVERLDEPSYLHDNDKSGAIVAAASGGAQVRAVATAIASGALEPLSQHRPRALVWIVGRHGQARSAAHVVRALLAQQQQVPGLPVVIGSTLPGWVGALDVVLVSGSDAGDPAHVAALAAAQRRGATVVCDLPYEGPVKDAGTGDVCWLPSLSFLDPIHGMLRHSAAGLGVCGALGVSGISLDRIADHTDAVLESLGPDLAVAVNPAKLLASDLHAASNAIIVYEDEVAGAVAHRLTQAFAATGVAIAAVPLADALRFAPRPGAHDIFHDEFLDGPSSHQFFGLVCAAPPGRVRALAAPLGSVSWIEFTESNTESVEWPQFETLVDDTVAKCAGGELAAAYALVSR